MMTGLPLISVVTPSFNRARFLEATIQSVLSQGYPRLEYIIVDGGSQDESVGIIKSYKNKLSWWVSEKDEGQTDALNKGFAHASGDVFAWLNSDDTYKPGVLLAVAQLMQEFPEIGLIYGGADYINEAGQTIGRFPAAQTDYRRLRQGYVHIPQQAAFFRGDLWRALGPLDPSFYFAMDYDLWLRIASHAKVKYVPQTWANFRLHSAGKTIAADERCWPEMLRIHYRDGGTLFAKIVAKYYLRKLIAPFWNWRRRRLLNRETS